MGKHTPGPWGIDGRAIVSGLTEDGSDWGRFVADIPPYYKVSREEAEANARLIAAAPDLLAMLQKAVRVYGVDMQPEHRSEFRAAIAKATGK